MSGAGPDVQISRSNFDDDLLRNWWTDSYNSGILARNTFFQSWEWNSTWHDHFVRDDRRRELVLLRVEKQGRIVAAVPLFLQQRNAGPIRAWRYLLWIADRLSQYPDLVTTERDAVALWPAIQAFMHREYPDAWMTLHDVLPESTAASFFAEGGERSPGEPYLRVVLAEGNEAIRLGNCSPHMQREILRARRLLEKEDRLEWRCHQSPDATLIEQLIVLNRARFGKASWFADERNTAFFRALSGVMDNELVISEVSDGGTPIHLMASYLHGDTVHYVLSGMNEDAKRFSPGTMNLDCTLRWAMRQGYRYFDFLRGDEGYKREFAPEERMSVHLTIPAVRGRTRWTLARAMQKGRKAVDRM
ncbi:MAG: GNAT family N-acetyltransferase [Bacteroidetes bacterium]|nr:GNAT family N-acetyltransferase [Bacteroidota bacterium]